MTEWWLKLTGDENLLRALSHIYTTADCLIAERQEGFFLHSSLFDSVTRPWSVWRTCEDLLVCVRALALLGVYDRIAIKQNSLWFTNGDGELEECRLGPRLGSCGLSYFTTDSDPFRDPGAVPKFISLYFSNANVRRALTLWDHSTEDWFTFCKLLEIFRKEPTAYAAAVKATGTGKREIALLERTANSEEGAGLVAARHAKPEYTPPKKPMRRGEAHNIMEKLLVAWLKIQPQGSHDHQHEATDQGGDDQAAQPTDDRAYAATYQRPDDSP
jgi:hypothetical protein